jgi:hypothetical protein
MTGKASKLEVPTGGEPVRAVTEAVDALRLDRGGVYRMAVAHDNGCPCVTDGQPLAACTCEIVHLSQEKLR